MRFQMPKIKLAVAECQMIPSGYGLYRRDIARRVAWACPAPVVPLFRLGVWLNETWWRAMVNVKPTMREKLWREAKEAGYQEGARAGYRAALRDFDALQQQHYHELIRSGLNVDSYEFAKMALGQRNQRDEFLRLASWEDR